MDVILPYKQSRSEELRWALKSLKNLSGVDKVYVIGERPSYNVYAIFVEDETKPWSNLSPHHNQISKYLTACNLDVSEDLLIMNDDFYILEGTEPKNYDRGLLIDHIHERKFDSYTRALKQTSDYLRSKGLQEIDFEMHIPMVVKKSLLKQSIKEIIPDISKGKTIFIRSYYGNRYEIESEYLEDPKNKLPLGIFGSSSNKSFAGEYGKKIREKLCE